MFQTRICQQTAKQGKHLQNRADFKSGREVEEEAIRRRAGMESKLCWQVGERAEE